MVAAAAADERRRAGLPARRGRDPPGPGQAGGHTSRTASTCCPCSAHSRRPNRTSPWPARRPVGAGWCWPPTSPRPASRSRGCGSSSTPAWSRSPRYDPGSGLTRLHTGPASRSSADQRAGRAGRQGPGVAYRLWSEHEHAGRRRFSQPEIATVDLAGLALELAVWGDRTRRPGVPGTPAPGGPRRGPGVAGRPGRARPLSGRPTADGRRMADLPLHPRLARMVIGSDAARTGPCGVRPGRAARGPRHPAGPARRRRGGRGRAGPAASADTGARHHQVDHAALPSARRRADVLARRAGVRPGPLDIGGLRPGARSGLSRPGGPGSRPGPFPAADRSGALGWPSPIRWRAKRSWSSPTSTRDQGDSRIRLAAALDRADLEAAAAAPVTTVDRGDRGTPSATTCGLP